MSEGVAKWIYIILAIGCAGSALGMAWFGLQVSARQGQAIASLPSLTNNLEAYVTKVDAAVALILTNSQEAVTILEAEPFVSAAPALASEAQAQLTDLNSVIGNSASCLPLHRMESDVSFLLWLPPPLDRERPLPHG